MVVVEQEVVNIDIAGQRFGFLFEIVFVSTNEQLLLLLDGILLAETVPLLVQNVSRVVQEVWSEVRLHALQLALIFKAVMPWTRENA